MSKTITGDLTLASQKVAVVVSRFNSTVTQALLSGAEDAFLRHGGVPDNLTIVWVPGAFEIPVVVRRLAGSGQFDGVLALGALIKGSTAHFDVLAHQVTRALSETALQSKVPVAFGVLTTGTIEQAFERAGTKAGNKGAQSMQSLIEMVNLLPKLP